MTTPKTAAGTTPGRPAPRPILADQLTALEALIVIGRTFAHLPAVDFQVGTVFPRSIHIHIHDDLGVFETWREALGIPAEDISRSTYGGRMTLTAHGTFARVDLELTGYSAALPEQTGGAR